MWHQLSLRRRILLGYGLGLLIMTGLVAFLIFQLEQINRQIGDLNATTAAEAQLGAGLAAQAAEAQQAVNRYLQQPLPVYREQATTALAALERSLARQQSALSSAGQRQRAADLAQRLGAYRETFSAIETLVKAQNTYRLHTNRTTLQASSLVGQLVNRSLGANSPISLAVLLTTQDNLQSASLAINRMLAEQSPDLHDLATSGLRLAEMRLQSLQRTSQASVALDDALLATSQSITLTGQLADNLGALTSIRSGQLRERSVALQRSADQIAQDALATLTSASAGIERQMRRSEQVALAALLGTLGLAMLLGVQVARTLTHPLNTLAAASERISQGDYEQPVPERDAGEIGRLVAAFNRMIATLRAQRAEVARQHAAMAERNRELEQTLAQLQRATAEREQLASTVRAMSVPIIPILRHVLVAPLVGEIDIERANLLTQRLLAGVVAQQARLAILDITGVAMLDPRVVTWLLQTASALQLLGARAMLAGVHPEVAQALVASGADLSQFEVAPDLRAAVEYALRGLGKPAG